MHDEVTYSLIGFAGAFVILGIVMLIAYLIAKNAFKQK